mmetsp:Transcript_3210/g.12654  ORF Transcript_3210/g.12654 Transcript_3210/m.12654 type:complete len:224 (+) Transcript_3210:1374-2045(+)
MKPNSDEPLLHANVSMIVSSSALKCFFTSLGMVTSARTNGSMMELTSKASRPSSRGIAGNLSVAVLYDATTTSIEHASTDRTNLPEPSKASNPARCASVGGGGGSEASSFCSAAMAAMSATDPRLAPLLSPFDPPASLAGDAVFAGGFAGVLAASAWRITCLCSFSRINSRKYAKTRTASSCRRFTRLSRLTLCPCPASKPTPLIVTRNASSRSAALVLPARL